MVDPETLPAAGGQFAERLEVSPSLVLRAPTLADAPRILELANRNQDIAVWFPWIKDMADEQDAKQYITTRLNGIQKGHLLAHMIENSGDLVGAISVYINRAHNSGNVGYWLDEAARGAGTGRRSLQAFSEYLLEDFNLHRLELDVGVDNPASQAIAERVGYVREGVRRQAWRDGDDYRDMIIYGLVQGDLKKIDA